MTRRHSCYNIFARSSFIFQPTLEANFPVDFWILQMFHKHFWASSYRFRYINILNFLHKQNMSQSRSVILSVVKFDGKCKNIQMSPTHFSDSSYSFGDIFFFNLYFQKVGRSNGMQFFKLNRSVANIKIYKCLEHIFALALTVSEIYTFNIFSLRDLDLYFLG